MIQNHPTHKCVAAYNLNQIHKENTVSYVTSVNNPVIQIAKKSIYFNNQKNKGMGTSIAKKTHSIFPGETQSTIDKLLRDIQKNSSAFNLVKPELKNNKEFILAAAAKNGEILRYIPNEFWDDLEIVLTGLKQCNLLRRDFDSKILNHQLPLIPSRFENHYPLLKIAISKNGFIFQHLHEIFRDNKFLFNEATNLNYKMIKFAGKSIKINIKNSPFKTIKRIIEKHPEAYLLLDDNIKNDKNFILELININPNIFQFLPPEFQKDNEIALASINEHGQKRSLRNKRWKKEIRNPILLQKIVKIISENKDYKALTRFGRTLQNRNTHLKIARTCFELVTNNEGEAKKFAACQYGIMCLKGIGGKIDQKQGIEILKKASRWDSEEAMRTLAMYYENQKNPVQAQVWKNEFSRSQLEYFGPKVISLGGTLLTFSDNHDKLKQLKFFRPNFQQTLLKKQKELAAALETDKGLGKIRFCPSYRLNNGICEGVVIDFITRVNALDPKISLMEFESHLITIAKRYESYPKISTIAIQSIYLSLFEKLNNNIIKRKDIFQPKGSQPFTKEEGDIKWAHEEDFTVIERVYKVKGQKLLPLPQLELPGQLTDEECLNRWISTTPDGSYEAGINVWYSNYPEHALALFKKEERVYIFDPNGGLIRCSKDKPEQTILNFLSHYYDEIENHSISIRKVEKE